MHGCTPNMHVAARAPSLACVAEFAFSYNCRVQGFTGQRKGRDPAKSIVIVMNAAEFV